MVFHILHDFRLPRAWGFITLQFAIIPIIGKHRPRQWVMLIRDGGLDNLAVQVYHFKRAFARAIRSASVSSTDTSTLSLNIPK